ncbi:MAG: hypothetical protein OXT74_14420 [Candidatus Poribacteria bacterium]|nr:hypothetical protein [Candidatus Poribacteria bacterium]
MASIRRYKDGRVAIVGDYCAGSPFVRQKWVRGEKRKATREEGKSGNSAMAIFHFTARNSRRALAMNSKGE